MSRLLDVKNLRAGYGMFAVLHDLLREHPAIRMLHAVHTHRNDPPRKRPLRTYHFHRVSLSR